MKTAFALRTLPFCALGLLLLTSCDQILERTLDCDLAGNDYLDAPRTKEARISWIWQASEPASMNCRSVFLVGVDYWPKGRPAGFGSPGWQPSAAEAEQLDAMNSSPAPVRVFITTTTRAEPFAAPPLRAKTIEDLTPSVEGFEVCH